MMKHLSADSLSLEDQSAVIKERNLFLREGKFTTIDSIYGFGDLIIIGDSHDEAASYLQTCLESSLGVDGYVKFQSKTEYIYDVQVWSTIDFDLSSVLVSK